MIDLTTADEQQAVAELSEKIGLEVLYPAARIAEAAGAVPADVWKTLFDSGLLAQVPERAGGDGLLDPVTQMAAVENLSYGDPGITLAAAWSGAASLLVGRHGTQEQVELLRSRVTSDFRGCVALYEGFGRSPGELTTTIERLSDGSVKITGEKVMVGFASVADSVVVVGVDPGSGQLRAAIVPPGPGVSLVPDKGRIGLEAMPTASVRFDTVLAGADLLGATEQDPSALALSVERLRLMVAAAEIGTARRAIEYAAAYSTERQAFGQPIAAFQGVSFLLAEAAMRIEAARLEVTHAATLLSGTDVERARTAVTKALSYAGEVALESTRNGVQVLGGHGFITDHPAELWYRSAAALAAIDFDPLYSSFAPAL